VAEVGEVGEGDQCGRYTTCSTASSRVRIDRAEGLVSIDSTWIHHDNLTNKHIHVHSLDT